MKYYKIIFNKNGDEKDHSYVGLIATDEGPAKVFGRYMGRIWRAGKYEYKLESFEQKEGLKEIYLLCLYNDDQSDLISYEYLSTEEAINALPSLPKREFFSLKKLAVCSGDLLSEEDLRDCLDSYRCFNEEELAVLKSMHEKLARKEHS